MTDEDKKRISEYMGWNENPYWWCEKCKEEKAPHHATYAERCADCGCPVILKDDHNFDANDAALCVQEIQKRGSIFEFYMHLIDVYNGLIEDGKEICGADNFTVWLFNADNFFNAMSQWLREGKK